MSDHPEVPRIEFNQDGVSLNIEEAVARFRDQLLRWSRIVEHQGDSTFLLHIGMRPCDCDSSLFGLDPNCYLHGEGTLA